ncbi:MAG: permease [Candidatus Thorarchaeota archaeon]
MQDILGAIIGSGLNTLWEYLSAHVLLCLIPAFFISGAFSALIPTNTILKYMGGTRDRKRLTMAYIFAAMSGLVLEVCSCTILPLFAGIWKKGAGFGPAITFLFAGPGITLLSTPLTAMVIGVEFAIIKLIFSIVIAIAIGVSMELLFREKRSATPSDLSVGVDSETSEKPKRSTVKSSTFFVSLTLVMIFGTAPIDLLLKILLVLLGTLATTLIAIYVYDRNELGLWMKETYRFIKMIFPILLVGVFISGMIQPIVPPELIVALAGTNSIGGNVFAVLFGTIAYFPTLVEVPIADMFLQLGMHPGPLMAYLIADPAISIQTLLVVNRIMKPARTAAYGLLLMLFSVAAGFLYGMWI